MHTDPMIGGGILAESFEAVIWGLGSRALLLGIAKGELGTLTH